jgi:hypothetical protein
MMQAIGSTRRGSYVGVPHEVDLHASSCSAPTFPASGEQLIAQVPLDTADCRNFTLKETFHVQSM